MKKTALVYLIFLSLLLLLVDTAYGYWVWTPETGSWINPKNAVKDTAKEQFEWAMHFYEAGDHDKAVKEFGKLIRFYPNSKYASKAQYYTGRSYEDKEAYYHAFLAYQKAVEVYPYIENREEIIKREYDIGLLFFGGKKAKILGVELLPALDKAVEIFEKVIINDPYGEYADRAQFKIGESYNKEGRFGEAAMAFQKLIEEYPKSGLVEEAQYQVAYSTYRASMDSEYNQQTTDEAIKGFEEFVKRKQQDPSFSDDANKVLDTLREKKAKSIFNIARFYERQRHFASAAVYYKEIAEEYPNTAMAPEALSKYTELERRAKEIEQKRALKKANKLRFWR